MQTRKTSAQRLKLTNTAEKEIMLYKDDHYLWHKHIHNVELDEVQLLKMTEMDDNPNTIDFSSRRTGKTFGKEMWFLKDNATNADQSLGIVAPKEAQAITNLNYHLEAIRRSPILSAYLRHKNGRAQINDTTYQFANRSIAKTYGIMGQVDGDDLTAASLEEVDDMPHDRLFGRFLPMLMSTRRAGAASDSINQPRIAITGVFKGADTLTDLLDSGKYHAIGCMRGAKAQQYLNKMVLLGELDSSQTDIKNYTYPIPLANCVVGAEIGILNKQSVIDLKAQMSADEFTRQLLCINTSSRNFIWESWVRRAIQTGLKANSSWREPEFGSQYKKRGNVSFGYDATGHGESETASQSALVVCEQIGGYVVFIFAYIWQAGTDEVIIKNDLLKFWAYFMPDYAYGDAFGVGMLTQLNEELFKEGLTNIDRRAIDNGNSTSSSWDKWAFAPLRFEGMIKHQMATSLQQIFSNRQAVLPYLTEDELEKVPNLAKLIQQLTNITQIKSSKSYASYKVVRKNIGDDLFDAAMAAVWGIATSGTTAFLTAVSTREVEYNQLLEQTLQLPKEYIA
jgi:hypothetical protein